jgi:hypothetical protein
MVDKHHTIIFEAGRELTIIRTETGSDFIQVISASPEGGGLLQENAVEADDFALPSGWHLRLEPVAERTVIDLPNPTEAWFFANGSSFQGPVKPGHAQTPDRDRNTPINTYIPVSSTVALSPPCRHHTSLGLRWRWERHRLLRSS